MQNERKKVKNLRRMLRKKEMTNASENEMMRIVFHSIIQFDNVHQFWCYRKKNSFPMHAFRHSMKLVYIVTIMDYRIEHHLYSVVFFFLHSRLASISFSLMPAHNIFVSIWFAWKSCCTFKLNRTERRKKNQPECRLNATVINHKRCTFSSHACSLSTSTRDNLLKSRK